MFCPKCSQQQVSDRQRFCSRCGFPLSVVAELIAANGASPVSEKSARRRSPRFDGVRQGVILMMLAIVLLPLVDVLPYHEAWVFMFLMAGLMRVCYAVIFQESARKQSSTISDFQSETAKLNGAQSAAPLPSANSIHVADFINPQRETEEMVKPSSVTESTTRLLDD
jgi:hypothetical protein